MRLIDADKLRKDVLDLPDCYNGFSDTYDKAMILDLVDEQPTVVIYVEDNAFYSLAERREDDKSIRT